MLFSYIVSLLMIPCGSIENTASRFSVDSHDFGVIDQRGGAVSCIFQFTNQGSRPFVIENIATSCDCIVPKYERQPVLPSGSGKIRVMFDPTDRQGVFEKKLWVTFSDGEHTQLTIRGTVAASPLRFPVDAGAGVALSGRTADFGRIVQGDRRERFFLVHNNATATRHLIMRTAKGSQLRAINSMSVAPGATDTLRLIYDLRETPVWGTLLDTVRLFIDGKRSPVSLSLAAQAIDAPQEGSRVPVIGVAGRNVLLKGSSRDTLRHRFTVRNLGSETLHIRCAECRGTAQLDVNPSGRKVAPQGVESFCVLLPPGIRRSAVVTLFTNDPATPVLRLNLQTRD